MSIATDVVTVLHPATEDVAEPQCLAPRLSSLQGRTVGLIDNRKRNANVHLEALGHLRQDRYGVSPVVTYRKISQSMPTPDEVLDQLASECDAIIHAVAD
jgi:predicted 3-demethylubiquinone-9 3-methyltransferase (glyoxalase superfamily)